MKCKDCIHKNVCKVCHNCLELSLINIIIVTHCPDFKDKDFIVESPVKVGLIIFMIF